MTGPIGAIIFAASSLLAAAPPPASVAGQAVPAQAPSPTPAPPVPALPTPQVAAPTPTAQFTATRGNLRFDRACRTITFDTLAADAACAARVGKGETGPTIEVTAATLQAAYTPANARRALEFLDRAIAAEHHPAALYLAGTLLTTGENIPPDYPRGIAYLEKAAAGGMDGSATRLALLYLNGRYLPPDRALARRILDRASAAGVIGAPETLRILDAEEKMHNFQILPNQDPAKVEVREYRNFDMPEIPPSFGFVEDLRRLHYSGYSDAATLARLERDSARLPTPYLFELARREAAVSRDRALGYFLLAQLRMSYDSGRCADPMAKQAAGALARLVAPDLRFAMAELDQARLDAAIRFALEHDSAMPAETIPWWVCYSGIATYIAVLDHKPAVLQLVPRGDWPRIRETARKALAEAHVPAPRPAPAAPARP